MSIDSAIDDENNFIVSILNTKDTQNLIVNSSSGQITETRKKLLWLAQKEILYFKALPWKFTVIKPKEESKISDIINLLPREKVFAKISQESTWIWPSKSVSDSDEKACSVSSWTDSNEVDLNDCMKDDIVVNMMNRKTGKAIGKNIPLLIFE